MDAPARLAETLEGMNMSGDEINEKLKKLTLSGVKDLNEQLGRGSYGRVFTVKYNGVICAAKEIHSILIDVGAVKYQDDFMLECVRCSELTHPNIVHFMGIYYPSRGSLPVMVMELMDESLTNYVKKPNISLKRKISILHDVAEGLIYLHTRNPSVIHRDLSPNNILLKHTGVEQLPPVAKIADLGVARIVKADSQNTKSQLTKAPGTPDFMPPETLVDIPKYGTALDVFSFGGLMLHTLTQEWPTPKSATQYDQVTLQAIKALNEIERRQQYIDKLTGEAEMLLSMILECLANDPTKRPTIMDLSKKLKPLKVGKSSLMCVLLTYHFYRRCPLWFLPCRVATTILIGLNVLICHLRCMVLQLQLMKTMCTSWRVVVQKMIRSTVCTDMM